MRTQSWAKISRPYGTWPVEALRRLTITIWHYFKSAKCYTRSLANSHRDGMLFSSGDSLKSVSNLSGEGLDLEQENGRAFLYTIRD
jgi:hypothetical protein